MGISHAARTSATLVLAAALWGAALGPVAIASPVCSDEPRTMCGDRIFPEAALTISFVQHDNGEFEAGIKALAADFPRFVRVRSFSDMLDKETLSAGGREIWMIEVTDFNAPEKGKVPVAVSLSVHGPERAGLEGGVRYAEDLARWATNEPDHELRNGTDEDSVGMPVSKVLKNVHLYLTNINPDGWSRGDQANGGSFQRGNASGVDLNREFPTKGWTYAPYSALSEPESKAWNTLARQIKPKVASDLHGELTSENNAFADIMYPAGQWDPLEQAQEERLARHMKSNVERYFEEQGIVVEDATGGTMKPAEYATAYDVVGYDDSGFMGDFFTEVIGAVEVDVEHFLSHLVPNSAWNQGLETAHIASVRAEIETLMIESLVMRDVKVRLNLGRTGYLFDPQVVKKSDGYKGPKPPEGIKPKDYSVTRMRYFSDLSKFATTPLRKVLLGDVLRKGLDGLDTLVISQKPYPRDPKGRIPLHKRIAKKAEAFVRAGGNLVLTDGAIRMLRRFKIVDKGATSKTVYNAGHINIEDYADDYVKGVHTTASQTYYEVPLGYSVDENSAPHWFVDRDAWEAAGGVTVAYITSTSQVGLGRMELGKGSIGIIGALLPKQTERYDHFYGLADYAVTVAGGQILNNMIAFGR